MVKLPPEQLDRLRPLFADFAPFKGCIAAGLAGDMGEAWVDDPHSPTCAHLHVHDHFVAGDPDASAADVLVASLPQPCSLIATPQWADRLTDHWGRALDAYERVTLDPPASWDMPALQKWADMLPAGCQIKRIDADSVQMLAQFNRAMVNHFESEQAFLERGFAFAVWQDGEILSACSTYTAGGGAVEMELETRDDQRLRGLGTAVASRFMLHAISEHLTPYWDAFSPNSARLAEKLGYQNPTPYTAYNLCRTG